MDRGPTESGSAFLAGRGLAADRGCSMREVARADGGRRSLLGGGRRADGRREAAGAAAAVRD